ncbi:MAG: family 43 glycosylhydrolase [Phycisphaerales bacterium]|nr:MAG: family 43 glycosylhydrolase [Phycisphaerales bacterium]
MQARALMCGVFLLGNAVAVRSPPPDEIPPKAATTPSVRVRGDVSAEPAEPTFVNPIYEGADPWVTHHERHYFLCRSEGDVGISVWKSAKLTDPGIKRIVWKAPSSGWNSRQVWAPELHRLDGRWYIYYAASDGRNRNHRTGVLEAVTDDPQGSYRDRGALYTGDDCAGSMQNRWAIDATPLELDGRLYLIWSGWPADEDIQYLYIAPMANPWTISGNRVRLCANDTHIWERVREDPAQRGLNEAPQVLRDNGRVFVVYSCSGSWEPTYKLGLLELKERADPLRPGSWRKHGEPVFQPTESVFGIGHASFAKSPDDREDWIIYHAKVSRKPGWQRTVRAQPFTWTPDGRPIFGTPIPSAEPLRVPSGEPANRFGGHFHDTFDKDAWDGWVFYGKNGCVRVADGHMSLGVTPPWGKVNYYRPGEKALVRGREWSDVSVQTRVYVKNGGRDAGILFRIREPSVGYDAQKGYFAGLIPGTQKVVLGKTNGRHWHELALVDHPVVMKRWYTLGVEASDDSIRVLVDGEIRIAVADSDYRRGMVGVRVVDSQAWFDEFEVAPR